MHKIAVYIPNAALSAVKDAMFTAGAGKIGDYSHCCFEIAGHGQFKPLENSNPHIGTQGDIETVEEVLVEMVCEDNQLKAALTAMIQAHPYETPAYAAWPIIQLEDLS